MTPQITHPVIGFRSWRSDGRGVLQSRAQDWTWDPGVNDAECLRRPHVHRSPAPSSRCECGLYAFHESQEALDYSGSFHVCGIVRGWGRTQIHRDGWRAEHAEVLAIIEPPAPVISERSGEAYAKQRRTEHEWSRKNAQEAARAFGVPLIPAKGVDAIASEFGKFVPEALRPKTTVFANNGTMGWEEEMVGMAGFLALALSPLVATWAVARLARRIFRQK